MKQWGRIPKMPGHRISPFRQLMVSLLVGLLLGVGAILWMDFRIRPMVLAISESALSKQVAQTIGTVLNETEIDYSDLVQLQYDESGTLSAVTTRMEQGNRLRGELTANLLEELTALHNETVYVPSGNLTGLILLSGHGFSIPVQVVGVSNVQSSFESALTPAGINQTLHQIDLVVDTELVLLLPGGPTSHTFTSRITVAETVLLGQVPENYTYFSQFDTAEEAANAHFDFGAGQN